MSGLDPPAQIDIEIAAATTGATTATTATAAAAAAAATWTGAGRRGQGAGATGGLMVPSTPPSVLLRKSAPHWELAVHVRSEQQRGDRRDPVQHVAEGSVLPSVLCTTVAMLLSTPIAVL